MLYSESDLVAPAIEIIASASEGISTSDLILRLRAVLKPIGRDAELIANRRDDHFSQKVRNLVSHNTLEIRGLATRRNGRFYITELGNKYWQDNGEVLRQVSDQRLSDEQRRSAVEDDYHGIVNDGGNGGQLTRRARTETFIEQDNDDQEDFDGLDAGEDQGGGPTNIKPWDPRKIRITTKSFTLREIVGQIDDGDIDLSPDFQREYVWKARQRTRLIESILLGIPLPAFYFNQSESGAYQVVDGVQRLSTISLFMNDGHRLSGGDLEYLADLHNLTFSELDPSLARRFRSAQIVVHVIEPQTPDEVKYDIFNRVNTLGSPLSAQEIRHAMSGMRSRAFIGKLAEDPRFDLATEEQYWRRTPDGKVRDSGRMTNRELALRFCAFRVCSIDEYRLYSSLDAFLMDFTKRIDGVSQRPIVGEDQLSVLENDFARAMTAAAEVLGPAAFRRWPPGGDRRGPINRAVFEAQANALADHSLHTLRARKLEIVGAFRNAFHEPEYLRSVTVGTGDPNRVAHRLGRTRAILVEALSC